MVVIAKVIQEFTNRNKHQLLKIKMEEVTNMTSFDNRDLTSLTKWIDSTVICFSNCCSSCS